MKVFNKRAESFFREIRRVEVYLSPATPYRSCYIGVLPNPNDVFCTFEIISESFSRSISRKKKEGNYFHDIEIGFPLVDIHPEKAIEYQTLFNDRKFAIVIISNYEKMQIGNSLEPLTIEVLDRKKEDGSGNDDFFLSITGETIITPKPQVL